jgi:hypothetical protein
MIDDNDKQRMLEWFSQVLNQWVKECNAPPRPPRIDGQVEEPQAAANYIAAPNALPDALRCLSCGNEVEWPRCARCGAALTPTTPIASAVARAAVEAENAQLKEQGMVSLEQVEKAIMDDAENWPGFDGWGKQFAANVRARLEERDTKE